MKLSRAGTLLLAGTVACSLAGTRPVVKPTPVPAWSPAATATPGGDVCHADGVTYCALNPAVTQATIRTTICVPGWTGTIRPSPNYTDNLKRQQLAQYADQHQGDPQWTTADTEEDHRLSLDLGGAPADVMNLSPEVHSSSLLKDQDEALLGGSRGKVCRGELTLVQAQQQLIAKWLGPYPTYRA